MLPDLENFYLEKAEPVKGCLLAMREIILASNNLVTEAWKYRMPFFCYKGKMFCYVWTQKKSGLPYFGIVEGNKINRPELITEKRSRMKIMLIDPTKDLPVRAIGSILKEALALYI